MKKLLENNLNAVLLAMLGGFLSLMLGLSVLFGWYTHNVSLIQISPVFVPMQFNTALGFLLAGLGLLLVISGHRRAGISCSIFVMLMGLLTLAEYVLGIDLGIDQFLMQHYITVETSSPGRMAPNTALCFLLTGTALATIGTRANIRGPALIVSILGSLTVGLGFIALTGYLSTFEAAYGWGQLTRMAVHTASGFILLGVALVSIAWHRDTSASVRLPTWFPLPVGIGAATIVVSLWQAVVYDNGRLMELYGGSSKAVFLDSMILATAIVFACLLTLAVYLGQLGRIREREVKRINTGLADEIAKGRQAQEKLKKSERLYATLSQVNQAIAREQDQQKLFQAICDVAVEFGKFRLAWIGLLDEDSNSIKPVALGGQGSECLQDIEVSLGSDMTTKKSVGRSLEEGKSVVFNELRNDPDLLPWCTQALEKQCFASAAFPLRLNDRTIGTFNVCAVEFHYFDEDETGLLEDMAQDISFALKKFEDERSRKHAVEQARQRDTVLDSVFQAIPDLFFLLDPDGTILEYRAGQNSDLYLQADSFHGRRMQDVLPKPVARQFEMNLRIVKESGELVTFEYDLEVSQKLRHWETRISQLPNRPQVIAIIRDITGHKRAQRALSVKEQEQREILNSMVDAVITIDEAGKIQSYNKAAETLFGYRFEEVHGKNIKRLMPESHASEHDAYLADYLETGDAHIIGSGREVEGQHKDKHIFPMRLSVAELPADDTGKRRFIGTCQDLTKIKQQEEQLRRSQKMDALGKLTGGIAHDFNNMLGVITGYADLLEDMLEGQPELAEYAHEIHHAGDRGAKLTKKLLAFSRQVAPEAVKLDLNKVLEKQQDMLQKTLTVRIKLLLDLTDEVWPVWLDNSDLEDAIVNISINAMHAMSGRESGAQLTIRASNQSLSATDARLLGLAAGDYVRLSLTDTGIGMDEMTQGKIFDPFFSTKGKRGTGLGLSQVFGFVKRSGGTIKVYSEPGHGSKFSLYFPRHIGSDTDEATTSSEDVIDLSGKENILIVDDEAALRSLASRLLGNQGYQVFCAENAAQALHILEREHVDLMLSDVIMPGMDGYKLAEAVQKKYPAIKIQMVSGFSETWNVGVTDEQLYRNLLHKPYNSQVLFKSIRALLDTELVPKS